MKKSSLDDSCELRRGNESVLKGSSTREYLEAGAWTLKEWKPVVYRNGDQRDTGKSKHTDIIWFVHAWW